ncbi:MAG TPA: nuclear transport factor 2 family protein [Gemmatimonas sp.]|nr:nuclear transport factor 2 family protein [Gemmatimonas sp.]
MTHRTIATAIALLFATPGIAAAQTPADTAAIRGAAMHYIEGFYEGDTTKLVRAVRPEVYKYGFSRPADSTTYRGMQMTWAGFMSYAKSVKANNRQQPATAVRGVKLLDVLDQTAAVKITAWWGTDYLLLGKFDGAWMITHVNWQSPPPAKPRSK